MNQTTKRFARTLTEAFGTDGTWADREVMQAYLAKDKPMGRLAHFLSTYRLYRRQHSMLYAAKIAWGCAFKGLPF